MYSQIRKISSSFLPLIFLLIVFIPLNLKASVDYNELITFAKQLESSISSGNPYYFNLCFNTEAIINKAVNLEENTTENTFIQGFIDGVKQEFDLGTEIINEIGSKGSFLFIRAYQQNGKSKILFRLISDYGIDYHEYEVESKEDKIMIVDGYVFTSAQSISNTFRLIYTEYLMSSYRVVENRRDKDPVKKIYQLAFSGKNMKAFKKWEKLPATIRYSKTNQLLGINLAKQLSKKIYFGTYVEYLKHFPDEPGKYFVPLDGLIKHGYYKAALENIDRLDEIVQEDPLLNVLRANIYQEIGNVSVAENYLCQVIDLMPEYETGYINLLGLYLKEKEFAKVTELLDKIIFTFDTGKEDLIPFFDNHPDFINSAEYQNWIDD